MTLHQSSGFALKRYFTTRKCRQWGMYIHKFWTRLPYLPNVLHVHVVFRKMQPSNRLVPSAHTPPPSPPPHSPLQGWWPLIELLDLSLALAQQTKFIFEIGPPKIKVSRQVQLKPLVTRRCNRKTIAGNINLHKVTKNSGHSCTNRKTNQLM